MPINTLPRDPITPEEQTSRPVLEVRRIDLVPETGDPIRLPIEAPTNVVSFKAGSVVEFEIHITDAEGNDLPIDGEFALPLAGQMGTSPRIVDVVFVSGVAVLTLGNGPRADGASPRRRSTSI